MKKYLLLCMLLSSFCSFAYNAKIDGIYYNFSGSNATVTFKEECSSDYSDNVVIPETVVYSGKTYRVTSIGDDAFCGCSGLTSITIPESVTSIGDAAFYGCSGLTSITIPESVTEIGGYAFSDCSGLTSITIPESVTSIGDAAFSWCSNLISIVVKSGNTKYDSRENCNAIIATAFNTLIVGCKNTIIPESVTEIGSDAFYGCSGLTSITIPESVTSIGSWAFYGCSGLTSITIPESVTEIGGYAFVGCYFICDLFVNNSSLSSNDTWGATLYDEETKEGLLIKDGVAVKCKPWATTVTIPESVTSIGKEAFYYCSSLTSVTIPESVTSIGDHAFRLCGGLTSIAIPNGVTSIGKYAFEDCNSLTTVIIGNSVTEIGGYAFSDCSGLTSITIPESVTSIGDGAFLRCTGLTSVDIKNSIIGVYMFAGCSGLTSLTIPESVTEIGSDAFAGCSGLTSLTIPESVTSIGDGAFRLCGGLTSIAIPNGVTSIGKYAFEGCTGLTSVTINSNTIASMAYSSSSTLAGIFGSQVKSYEFGGGVESIGNYACYKCSNLTSVTIPESVTSIGSWAFYYCNNLSIFVNQGSTGLFALWEKGYTNVYDKEAGQNLLPFGESTHTASSINGKLSYLKGPANITAQTLTLNGVTIEGDLLYLSGLNPNTSYTATYTITVDDQYTYTGTATIKTDALALTTAQPKVINEGNIVVGATSNLDDAETNVGFQWRRTDWTDDFDSKTGGAYLYEGEMQGYIRNLNTNYLWKYRPFYASDSGTTYYGDWKGIDPTDYSYFDPTVHTYAKTEIEGNAVQLKGYVQRGTDNVTSQGFVYWTTSPQTTSTNPSKGGEMKAPSVPSTAQRVTATGTVMEASLTGLEYNTTYNYVAFVTTSEGETFYGEEQTFTTGADPTGIETIHNSQFTIHNEGVYDLSGRKIVDNSNFKIQNSKLKKGIYIVNGKKVFIQR